MDGIATSPEETDPLLGALAGRIGTADTLYRQKLGQIAAGLEDVIAMGLGDPDLDSPAHVRAAAIAAIEAGQTHYTHPCGMPALREAIAAMLARDFDLDYTAPEIMVTAGTQEGVLLCMLALLDPGDEVLVPAPRFTSYDTAVQLAGGVLVDLPTVEEEDFAITAAAIEARLTPRTKAVVLITPNNPTGAVTPPAMIREIAELAIRRNLVVISDEIYAELMFDGAEHLSIATLPGMRERTITMNGFSKSHAMTGWRIGYLAAPEPLINRLTEPRHTLSINACAISQAAALAAATGPRSVIDEMVATYAARRAVLLPRLDALGFTYAKAAGSFYVYANVSSSGLSASDFCEKVLREARVHIQPGKLFADANDNFVRFSVLQPEARITEAMDRIEEARSRIWA